MGRRRVMKVPPVAQLSLDDFPEGFPLRERRRIRFSTMLVAGPPDPIEWVFGTIKTVFGGWLMLPLHTFLTSPHLYRYAAQLPEWLWGGLFFALGVLQWTAWYYDQRKCRFFVGLLAAMLWDVYGYDLWRGDHRSVALVFMGSIAGAQLLADIWLYDKAFPKKAIEETDHDGN